MNNCCQIRWASDCIAIMCRSRYTGHRTLRAATGIGNFKIHGLHLSGLLMQKKTGTRILAPFVPTEEDIERARLLTDSSCPRRYCWWWRTLSFDWDTDVTQGCTFGSSEKPPDWPKSEQACCRLDVTSSADHFEPRDPHMIEDGIVPGWVFKLK